jgi:ethanolaminephosphotransferase
MNEGGNHGGSDTGETESALVFISPKFRTMRVKNTYECPTVPTNGTNFDYYRKVEQQDLVPSLSALLGLPIPRNSIGKMLSELRGMWPDEASYSQVLARNAQQLWRVAHTICGPSSAHENGHLWSNMVHNRTSILNQCTNSYDTVARSACLLASTKQQALQTRDTKHWTRTTLAYEEFIAQAQQTLIKENRSFNLARMAAGIAFCAVAMIVCCYSIGTCWPSRTTSISCACIVSIYGLALFTSTSEKSEQYFWHLATPAWTAILAIKAMNRMQDALIRHRIFWAWIIILTLHCTAACWPFLWPLIEGTLFADHKALMWSTLLITHFWISTDIVHHTLAGIVAKLTAVLLVTPLVYTAFVFKIGQEFEHAGGSALPFSSNQIVLFRTLFGTSSLAATVICIVIVRERSQPAVHALLATPGLPERLHHLLTLMLMTQSRIPNLPLLICLDYQRSCLRGILLHATHSAPNTIQRKCDQLSESSDNTSTSSIYAAITVLTFSHSSFFSLGGSNSISTIDLSNAFNGITNYDILTVGILLFSANWTGPIWWSSAACSLVTYDAPQATQPLDSSDKKYRTVGSDKGDGRPQAGPWPWLTYLSTLSTLMAAMALITMILCTVRREHHTVWMLWGSKHLYSVFWVLEWHVVVSLILSSCLRSLRSLG